MDGADPVEQLFGLVTCQLTRAFKYFCHEIRRCPVSALEFEGENPRTASWNRVDEPEIQRAIRVRIQSNGQSGSRFHIQLAAGVRRRNNTDIRWIAFGHLDIDEPSLTNEKTRELYIRLYELVRVAME